MRTFDVVVIGAGPGGEVAAGQLPWLAERGVHLVRGWGRLAGDRRVAVGDVILRARRAVILAGGTRSALPPIDGLAAARPWIWLRLFDALGR
jgi:pyruvate/2-oxoglutarate dehydrogenase complex dihydrolipoamide dehydrogenase (E3) component